MAIAFRSGSERAYGSTATSSTLITKPTGTVDGDFLIIFFIIGSGSSLPITIPTGFTQLGTNHDVNTGGFYVNSGVYYKIAASETTGWDISHTATGSAQGLCLCYTGVNTTTPIDSTPSYKQYGADGRVVDATGVTTVTDGALVLLFEHDWSAVGSGSVPPTGFTERYDTTISYAADMIKATAGATGTITYNSSNAAVGEPWQAYVVPLRPATAGGVSGTSALVQGADVLSSAGYPTTTGTSALLPSADTFSASGTSVIVGTASLLPSADVFSASGTSVVSGTADLLQDNQTFSATGSVSDTISGTASILQGEDLLSAVGSPIVVGSGDLLQVGDILSSVGSSTTIGSGNLLQEDQILSGFGSVADVLAGIIAFTQDDQIFNAVGIVPVAGTASLLQEDQIFSATGTPVLVGIIALTQIGDIWTAGAIVESIRLKIGSLSVSNLKLAEQQVQKVKKGSDLIWTYVAPPEGPFDPASISGLQAWYDSSDASTFTYSSGVAVSQWRDKSAFGRHLNQATVAYQPLRNGVQNGLATVVFDGSNDVIPSVSFTLTQPFTIALVLNWNAYAFLGPINGSNFSIYSAGVTVRMVAGGELVLSPVGSYDGVHVWVFVFNGLSSNGYKDGVLVPKDSGNPTSGTTTGISQGYWGSQGDVCIYNKVLSTEDRQELELYLKTKWGTP